MEIYIADDGLRSKSPVPEDASVRKHTRPKKEFDVSFSTPKTLLGSFSDTNAKLDEVVSCGGPPCPICQHRESSD